MGLVGRIEDVPLSEILHVVSRSQKKGTLVLNDGSGLKAVVIFDDGKVIQAGTNDLRDSLGSLLYVKGLVDEDGLRRALEIQRGPKLGMRLGQVLVEMKALTQEKLEETIRKHIENLVCMLVQWEGGTFSFENGRPAVGEDLEAVMKEFLIDDGLSTEYLLVESARIIDEINRDGPKPAATVDHSIPLSLLSPAEAVPVDRRRPVRVVTEYRPPEAAVPPSVGIQVGQPPVGRAPVERAPAGRPLSQTSLPGPKAAEADTSYFYPPRPADKPPAGLSGSREEAPPGGAGPALRERDLEILRTMSEGMRAQASFSGVATLALRYARSLVDRTAMFRVNGDEITEIGRIGMKAEGGPADKPARKAKLPAAHASVFAEVVRDRKSKRGRFGDGSWDRAFVAELGGVAPDEYFMVPVICEGRVAAILYGDNAPESAPLPPITGLEILMQQAGLTLEKGLLEERLRPAQRPAPPRAASNR